MSKFFKALEQAERERALRERTRQEEAGAVAPAPLPSVPPARPGRPPADEVARPVAPRLASAAPPVVAPARAPEPGPPESPDVHRAEWSRVDEHLVSLLSPATFEAEQYRGLRHVVEQLHRGAGLTVLAVSSPALADGKTTTAINLAGALAQAPEARVLLVDADFRRPSVARALGLADPDRAGLVDAILDAGLTLDNVLRRCPPFNLTVLPAGEPPRAPYELLKTPRLEGLLAEARRRFDYIVLDTPPLISVPDSRVIANWVDGILMVVATHRTPRKLLQEALAHLDPDKVVGLVFNGDDRPLSGYAHGYGYGLAPTDHGPYRWSRALGRLRAPRRREPSASRATPRGRDRWR